MESMTDRDELLIKAEKVQVAAATLALKTTDEKNQMLHLIADALISQQDDILTANQRDMSYARKKGTNASLLDRLLLTPDRIQAMSDALIKVSQLPDPIGNVLEQWTRPNGLLIKKIRVPLGAVGMVYEARPNVTVDAASLCLKTGNAVFLRGSSSALESNKALVAAIHQALLNGHFPKDSVMLLEDTSHETADRFFHLTNYLDVLIPRGSRKLIETVVKQASVPVLETGAGNCHLYIDQSAQPQMAIAIALNAKTQRPSVCNTIETIIVHEQWLIAHGDALIQALTDADVQCRIDSAASSLFPELPVANQKDWETEYLDKIVAIKVVSNLDQAIAHIARYSTRHSEAIISEDPVNVQRFFREVDASTLYHNASTRFTDGEMFGFGAEIGISTQKLHARGPMGLNALTTIKYLVEGSGQVRS